MLVGEDELVWGGDELVGGELLVGGDIGSAVVGEETSAEGEVDIGSAVVDKILAWGGEEMMLLGGDLGSAVVAGETILGGDEDPTLGGDEESTLGGDRGDEVTDVLEWGADDVTGSGIV